MIVGTHRVVNFRNFSSAEFSPSPGVNLICGANGQGKTNLLESLFLTAVAKSFRRSKLHSMIQEGHAEAACQSQVEGRAGGQSLEIRLRDSSKLLKRNDKKVKNYRDFFGHWVPVLFSPEDHWMIKLGPEYRRPYFDLVLSFRSPTFLSGLLAVKKIIAQKKELLSAIARGEQPPNALNPWNQALVEAALPLISERREFCEQLNKKLSKIYRSISHKQETSTVEYQPGLAEDGAMADLERVAAEEIRRERCLIGPQRDDYQFLLDGRRLKEFASQGEQKTFLLSLKLFEIEQAREIYGENPVLLIDDLGSELDPLRNQSFLRLLKEEGLQAFITTTEPEKLDFPLALADQVFRISAGRFLPPA